MKNTLQTIEDDSQKTGCLKIQTTGLMIVELLSDE